MSRLGPYALGVPTRFAAALAAAVGETTRRTPAPRDLPFFALDHPEGAEARLLERLSELGIFRFYEHVLDFGAGLGGPARWLSRRRGCRVTAVEAAPGLALASRLLVRRAHLDSSLAVVMASLSRLPLSRGSFTHAWSVETLHREGDKAAVLAEVFRAVRPGGHVAIQDWVVAPDRVGPRTGHYESAEVYTEGLRRAGFGALRVEGAVDLREPDDTISEILRKRVLELLGGMRSEERSDVESAEATLVAERSAITAGQLRLVQMFAQKPV